MCVCLPSPLSLFLIPKEHNDLCARFYFGFFFAWPARTVTNIQEGKHSIVALCLLVVFVLCF